eukprot:8274268-Alexandrium_andersonii.AAC.1
MLCQRGGWRMRRHDDVRDVVAQFAVGHGGAAATECILPYAAPGAQEARVDAVLRTARAAGQPRRRLG